MTYDCSERDLLISVDVETAGPNPSQYSLLAIGACPVFSPQRTFYVEIKPVNMAFTPAALESCGLSLEILAAEGVDPAGALRSFESWLEQVVPQGKNPIFAGFNAPFDWMFINDYFHRFLGHNPFGHAAIDIKSYYMGRAQVPWAETTMRSIAPRYLNQPALTHHALRDALDQADILRKLLLETTS